MRNKLKALRIIYFYMSSVMYQVFSDFFAMFSVIERYIIWCVLYYITLHLVEQLLARKHI